MSKEIDKAKDKLNALKDSSADQRDSLKQRIDDWLPGKN